jgi:hypothetical protein
MKLDYRIVELAEGDEKKCNYCFLNFEDPTNLNFNTSPATHQMVALDKETGDYVDIVFICDDCKKDFDNNILPWCEKCGRLKRNRRRCFCHLENEKDKVAQPLSEEVLISRAFSSRLENKTKKLEQELTNAKEEIDVHLEALQVSEEWSKRQKQELLDRIKKLEEENAKLNQENKQLREQQNGQLATQIEIKEPKKWPWKLKK